MKNILVIFGGTALEKDVSVITGVITANNLNKELFTAVPIFIDENGFWYTGAQLFDVSWYKTKNIKQLKRVCLLSGDNKLYLIKNHKLKAYKYAHCIINCIHGVNGEDGAISMLANLSNIPMASPDAYSSCIAMDKYLTKLCLSALKINVLPYKTYSVGESVNKSGVKLKYPLIVKPLRQGSSIGIEKANNYDELVIKINKALNYDERVIVEPYLQNLKEYNVAIYCDNEKIKVSNIEEPITKNDILTFEDKYSNGEKEFPANVSKELELEIKRVSKKVYKGLNFFGIIRIDFLYDANKNKLYVNEINGVPGSLSCYLISDTFYEFSKILDKIIEEAIKNFNRRLTEVKKYESTILNINGAKGNKLL